MTPTSSPEPHYSTVLEDREGRLAAGTRVLGGRIEVVRELARGGMAVVYQAIDHGRGGEAVALKVGIAGADAREMAARFHSEARLGASLAGHPNVVRPLWVGSLDGPEGFVGRMVLVTELVVGTSLDVVMVGQRTGLPVARACAIARDVARALGELHRRGIVHRDVKPGNVIVAGRGGGEHARLIDFGLAYSTGDGWEARSADLTADGHAPGTPLYMSPQQAAHLRPSPAFDVYSLGVMLYELCSGSPPYDGYGLGELLARKCDPQGMPFPIAKMCPELPEWLAEIVHRCLRYEPSERPTAEEVARALEDGLGGGEVTRRPPRSRASRASRGWWLVAAAATVVLAAVVASSPWGGKEAASAEAPASEAEASTFASAAYTKASVPEVGSDEPAAAPVVPEVEPPRPEPPSLAEPPERRPPGKVRKPGQGQAVDAAPAVEAAIDACSEEVDAASDAALRGQWTTVLRLTKKSKCWPGAAARERTRLRVRALFETERYAECVELGEGSSDPSLVRRTEICKTRATGENGLP